MIGTLRKHPSSENTLTFLLSTHIALSTALILWFSPITQPFCKQLDIWIFEAFNGSLTYGWWQKFWGILNHRREVTVNLIFAALLNVWAIGSTKNKSLRVIRIKQLLYFWICFEIGFTLQDVIFNKWLCVQRDSPSLVLQPVIKLSEILQNINIKDSSTHSFPGGHAFALAYWASFSWLISPKKIAFISVLFAGLLCFPRLMSGAHWASDVLFSILIALLWLSWTLYLPIYGRIVKPKTSHV